MERRVFEYSSYTEFLAAHLSGMGEERGRKSRMAEYLGVRPAFLSQVTSGKVHLTLENAALASSFLKLDAREERYFLALVGHARSGNTALKAHYATMMKELRQDDEKISRRVEASSHFTVDQQLAYFTDWKNSVIQLMISNPRYTSAESIAEALGVGRGAVTNALTLLLKLGIIARAGKGYRLTNKRIHIDSESPLLSRHHMNWRLQAIQSLERKPESDLHYSSVWSLGKEDVTLIKKMILELIQKAEPVLRKSPDEAVYSLCFDWFKVD